MIEVVETEDDRNRKAQLLAAIRDKHKKKALRLLDEGAGVDYRDETGSYPLHYAASEGYDDVIEVLLEKGAKVTDWNNNGQTAVHQAAMHGHARSIVTLVAGGAVVGTLDNKGYLALEYAIKNKHVTAVKLLCKFGSEPLLLDWSWIAVPNIKKKKDLFEMAKTVQHQNRLIPGYRHKGIIFDVAKVTPEKRLLLRLEKTGVEVKVVEGQEPFYLYLCQTEEAYGSPPPLGPDEEVFGHLLECQTWGPRVQTITLIVTVNRVLRQNEEIVLRPATPEGSVDKVNVQEVTTVTITVPLQPTGITNFTMASREKKQIFKISKEAVVLKPESEPEAEIDIPAGTFDSGDLVVKFVDTTKAMPELEQNNQDPGESGDDPVLLTNILDICTTDGQQPQKDIQMMLPVNVKNKSKDVVVLVTSNPDPNLEKWDWEVIPAEINGAGKAVFTVKHFSSNIVISRSRFDADPEGVQDLSRNAHLRNRKVEFLVALKKPEVDETKTDMIITCGTKRQISSAKRKYYESYKCFIAGQNTDLPMVPEGQTFKIVIRGNLKEGSDDENMKLIFKSGDQESSRALEIVSTCPDQLQLSGEVVIIKKTKTLTVERVDAGCFDFCCSRCRRSTKVEVKEPNTLTQPMCIIPFIITLTRREPDRQEGHASLNDLPEITWRKLQNAVCLLSAEESKLMGVQLGLNESQVAKVEEDTMDNKDLAINVIRKWHLLMAKNDMVSQLMRALDAIGRRDLIQKIKQE